MQDAIKIKCSYSDTATLLSFIEKEGSDMKYFLMRVVALFTLSFVFIFPAYATETYTLDPLHSYVLWHINHFGFSNPSGKWLANGTLVLDQAKPQNSKVNVTIHL